MKRELQIVNVAAMSILMLFLGVIVVNGLTSRQPWSLVCYKCKACDNSCVLGIDPQGFVDAALAGNSQIYMYTTNVRLPLATAAAMDPSMLVTVGERHVTALAALNLLHIAPQKEVTTYKVQARHAAQFCLRCGACERQCVLGLPLMRMIEKLRSSEQPMHLESRDVK
jgi:hypothetical protein